ncbi:MAG: tripartite tricarboxylate transporter substrate-binding protein [Pseudorhodoplanes sp.]
MRVYFALLLALVASPLAAQDGPYPSRPIRIVQPSAAGGPSDVLVRMIAEALQERLGQPVVVENKPGAGGVIGAETVAKAAPDGYTILSVGNFLFTTAALRTKMPYDAVKDFTGLSLISSAPIVLVANKDFPAKTLADVVELAKKSPDGLTYTSPNFGGVPFLAGQLLMRETGIKLQHVTYSGSPAAQVDVMAGRIPLMFDLWSSAKQHVETGNLKVIAVVTKDPLVDDPKVPLMGTSYPVFDFTINNALIVTAQTPKPIVDRLTQELHAIVKLPAIEARMRAFGLSPATSTPEEYNALAARELAKWQDLARTNNLTIQ